MEKLKRRGILFVLSSPSGAGKSSIASYILENDKSIGLSVSCTTRNKRKGEVKGKDYQYISISEFNNKIKEGFFLEWAKVFDNFYGTPSNNVKDRISKGFDVLFDIDWQGTQQLSGNDGFDIVTIFILPPTKKELEERLKRRAQDTAFEVNKRMLQASDEISHYMEYNYIIINNDLEKASQEVLSIIKAERLKRKRYVNLNNFVKFLRA